MIKLIATDMDGTFLDHKKTFSYKFLSQFYEMQKKDIRFVIASGNQFLRLYAQFIPMSEEMYFIADNGSYIAKGPKLLYVNTITEQKLYDTLQSLSHSKLFILLSGLKGAHLLNKDRSYQAVADKYYLHLHYHDSFNEVHDKIMKISLYDPHGDIHSYEDDIRKILPKGLNATTAGNEWLDIQNVGVNKGAGMKYLMKYLHISADECAAFGDAMNDYMMFKDVKYGYAMKNADENIKAVAFKTLPWTNDEQGVVKEIDKILKGQYD